MRLVLIAPLLVLTALSARAADGRWTPAPVPNVGVNDHVTPSDRAGESNGSVRDAPFSDIPIDSVAAGGATSSNLINGVQAPDPSPK